ncbi:MAG: hypothetical protein AB1716_08510 [Planctomycetota bacterium]
MVFRRVALGAVLLVVAAGAGCHRGSGAAVIMKRPGWSFDRYQRLLVTPARASRPAFAPQAGALADYLTDLLARNGQFRVQSHADLRDVVALQDLSRLTDAVDEGTALSPGKLEIADAVVVAKVIDVRPTDKKFGRRRMRPAQTAGGRIVMVEEVVPAFTRSVELEGSIHVTDPATGKILISHTARKIAERTTEGRPPAVSMHELERAALRALAAELYAAVAPTPVRVKFDGDMLFVATGYYDGRYERTSKLPRDSGEFLLVVLGLPEACEGNEFRVTITAREGREDLFARDFAWAGDTGPGGVSFRVATGSLAASGAVEFVVKLYSVGSPEPVLIREFSLREN